MTEFARYKELLTMNYGNKSERHHKQIEQLVRGIHKDINDKLSPPISSWSSLVSRPRQVQVRQQDIVSLHKHGVWQDYLQRLLGRVDNRLTPQQVRHIAQKHLREANAILKKQLKQSEHVSKRFASLPTKTLRI